MFALEDYLDAAIADDWMTDDELASLEEWEAGDDLESDYGA